MIRKLFVLTAFSVAVLLPAVAFAGSEERKAEADLASIGNSGITAEIEFVDTGSALLVKGEAEGLNPSKAYISLIYDNGSAATGPTACEPSVGPGQPGFLDFPKMFVGAWLPMGSSERTLTATKTGASYTPVGTFRTVSVREVVPVGLPQLRACGLVVTDD